MVLDGATGNYVTVDNFRLTLNEPAPSTFATIHKELQAVVDQAKAISENLDTPEQKELDAATAAVEALTDELAAKEPNMKTVSELIGGVNNISETILDFLKNTTPADLNSPYDITFMMENSAMTDTEIWGQVPEQADGIGQFKDEAFTMQQSVLSMPKGVYGLSLQAFQHPCSSADLASKYADGTLKATASITSRSIKKVKTIMDEAQPSPLGQGRDLQVGHFYVPDDTRSAAAYFAAGLYDNMVIFNLLKATDINLKISNTNTSVGDWTCIGNLRLFYYGYNTRSTFCHLFISLWCILPVLSVTKPASLPQKLTLCAQR